MSTTSYCFSKKLAAGVASKLSLAVALSFLLLLETMPLTANSAVVQKDSHTDPDALFLSKADPLLQTIRRAAFAEKMISRREATNFSNKTLEEANLEINALSHLAGVERQRNGATRVSVTVSLRDSNDAELKAAGFAVGARIGQLATIEADVERLPELAALASVSRLTAATRSYPNNDLSRRAIGVDDPSGLRAVTQTGRGAIVGFIDDGIDFRHLDFTLPGTSGQQTRIKALLDMTVYNSQAPPLPPDPNWDYVLPGSSAPIGHLYTEAVINSALHGGATIQQSNKTGHGTHVAGTAAGNGLAGPGPGKYAGMAPEADLIVVKASRQNDGTDNFLESDLINALAFIQQKASELGEPFVINMSMAGHFGPHDGTRANELAIDSIVNGGPGRAVCISGGSTGDMHAHASGSIPASSDLSLRLNVRDATQTLWLSYAKTDNVTVSVTRADGVQSGPVAYNSNLVPGLSNQYMDVYNTLDDKRDADPQNDQKAIIVILKPGATALGPPPHTWSFTLHGDSITNGHFDAWASLEGDFISNIDDTRQTTIPGTSRSGITVGGYVTRDGDRAVGDYASFSSQGPTADGRLKPDISAPAFTVYSSKAAGSLFFNSPLAPDSNFHVGSFGNSFSTPAVSGAIALLFQVNPQLTTNQIKQIISNTATHDVFTGGSVWHERFGAGKLNIAVALNSLPAPTANSIDDARFFVRQHYLDFLNRAPDQGGLDFWTNKITQCGTDTACVHSQRIGVSAEFFIALEFQETGYVVYRLYRSAYGAIPGAPTRANVTFPQFIADRARLIGGSGLPQSTIDFANTFVARPEFKQAYTDNSTAAEFINKLFDTASLTGPSYDSQRQSAIDALNAATKTRAQVLLDVIEIQQFKDREYNPAFVLMQYFGYLRRDPDQGGYDFWLDVVSNRALNNYRGMVCAFITSAEYQLHFGSAVTRTNHDCAQ